VADTSYLDVPTLRTLAAIRYQVRARIAQKYSRCKLADDGTLFGPGQAIVTPSTIRLELIALFAEWEDAGLVQNAAQFSAGLQVVRNGTDVNRLDALIPPDLVNQFMVFAAQVQFLL
jgi:phage tail sheath gpL-like